MALPNGLVHRSLKPMYLCVLLACLAVQSPPSLGSTGTTRFKTDPVPGEGWRVGPCSGSDLTWMDYAARPGELLAVSSSSNYVYRLLSSSFIVEGSERRLLGHGYQSAVYSPSERFLVMTIGWGRGLDVFERGEDGLKCVAGIRPADERGDVVSVWSGAQTLMLTVHGGEWIELEVDSGGLGLLTSPQPSPPPIPVARDLRFREFIAHAQGLIEVTYDHHSGGTRISQTIPEVRLRQVGPVQSESRRLPPGVRRVVPADSVLVATQEASGRWQLLDLETGETCAIPEGANHVRFTTVSSRVCWTEKTKAVHLNCLEVSACLENGI